MSDPSDVYRDNIHQVLAENSPHAGAAILTGWVLVTEWMDDQDVKWLAKAHSSSLSSWTANGFHHEALYGDWPDDEDDDDG